MSGTMADLIARLEAFKTAFPERARQRVEEMGDLLVEDLKAAAPKGKGPGPHLANSFTRTPAWARSASSFGVAITCSQGQKLRWILGGTGVYAGRGRIYPKRAQALYWPGAPHPYRSIAGMRANDFLTPAMQRWRQALPPEFSLLAHDAAELL